MREMREIDCFKVHKTIKFFLLCSKVFYIALENITIMICNLCVFLVHI